MNMGKRERERERRSKRREERERRQTSRRGELKLEQLSLRKARQISLTQSTFIAEPWTTTSHAAAFISVLNPQLKTKYISIYFIHPERERRKAREREAKEREREKRESSLPPAASSSSKNTHTHTLHCMRRMEMKWARKRDIHEEFPVS